MSLGEKITLLRKEKYWSQEELAMQMEVSRQSVSKWESDASVPELDKLIKLGEIFDVSLDYLLKDEKTERETGQDPKGEKKEKRHGEEPRFLPDEEAEGYMGLVESSSKWMAAGVALCILSPILFLLLEGLAAGGLIPLAKRVADGIGLAALLLFVGGAAAIFILNGMALEKYSYLEREPIALSNIYREIICKKKQEFEATYRGCISAGAVICILSVAPIAVGAMLEVQKGTYLFCLAGLLLLAAFGVYQIVWSSYVWGCYARLLQEGEYTIEKKRKNKKRETLNSVYWCVVTAVYLLMGFRFGSWGRNWLIWPCAGVLYPAVCSLLGLGRNKEG